MTTSAHRALPATAAALALLSGCGADGPARVDDGSYRFLAASSGSAAGAGTTLAVRDGEVTLTTPAGATPARLGQRLDEPALCGTDGTGEATALDTPLTVGDVELASPAMFGDCGLTRPTRVTLVDLDAPTEGVPGFSRWVEFCLAEDADCPQG